jgi:P-type Cu2+ transporter
VNGARPTIEIVHRIPGRIRFRVPALRSHPELAERLLAAGMAHPGVRSVRVNLACASVVVEGDTTAGSERDSLGLIHTWLATPSERRRSDPSPASPIRRLVPLGLALASVALTFLGGWWQALAVALSVAGALPIGRRALTSLVAQRRLTVDQLDSAAIGLLVALGDVRGAALISGLVALGEEIRERTGRRSQRAALDLQAALGRSAWLVRGQTKIQVGVDQLRVHDTVVVYPGDLVPVDGLVVDGSATVDQKLLTGEAMPILKAKGDRVFAGTDVADGRIYVRAEAVGKTTRAGWIVKVLEEAPVLDSRAVSYANRFADRLVAPTFALAGLSLALTGNFARAAAILIVDFATGIRVSAPTTIMATLGRAARDGILIKGGRAVEQLATADAIVFDKTGTLTHGEPDVTDVVSLNPEFTPDDVLALAASAEQRLRHPTARAVVRHARHRHLAIPRRQEFQYTTGLGVLARIKGRSVRVGSARFLAAAGFPVDRLDGVATRLSSTGASLVYVAVDDTLAGLLAYRDPLRAEASAVIERLRALGVREILIVTGDEIATAQMVAGALGVRRVHASALPDEKAEIVRELQRQGHTVAVVGDGINDSPALSLADVSVSLPHGADVARETADVVLMEPDLWGLVHAIQMAREGIGLIRQNLVIIGVPNAAAMALATAGRLSPVGATLLNNGSTIVAAVNSLRPLMSTNGRPVSDDIRSSSPSPNGNGAAREHAHRKVPTP